MLEEREEEDQIDSHDHRTRSACCSPPNRGGCRGRCLSEGREEKIAFIKTTGVKSGRENDGCTDEGSIPSSQQNQALNLSTV